MASLLDILNQMGTNTSQGNTGDQFALNALQQRFQPTFQDAARGAYNTAQSFAAPQMFKAQNAQQAAVDRVGNEIAPLNTLLQLRAESAKAMPDFTKMAQFSFLKQASGQPLAPNEQATIDAWRGMGQQGLFVDPASQSIIRTNSRMPGGMIGSPFTTLPGSNSMQLPTNAPQASMQPGVPNPPMSTDQVFNQAAGQQMAQPALPNTPQFGTPKAQAEYMNTLAKGTAEKQLADTDVARSTQDVVGLYGKIKQDAAAAPSGLAENMYANATNALGMPSPGAIAKGSYDADLNNLYLAMIRSLKGTGRVMQSELQAIQQAQPKSTDSLAVKQAKADAHMAYYQNKMKELGYDPASGQPLGNNQLAPSNMTSPAPSDQSGWSIQRVQ